MWLVTKHRSDCGGVVRTDSYRAAKDVGRYLSVQKVNQQRIVQSLQWK